MSDATATVLAELLEQAGLPEAIGVERLRGRGFNNEISVVEIAGRAPVVLRRWLEPRDPETLRGRFLADHALPAPRILTAGRYGSLVEFVSGRLLGDLIEDGEDTPAVWRAVGVAYRQVHDVQFPPGLVGRFGPDALTLRPVDPVAELHRQLDGAVDGLTRRLPEALVHLDALGRIVDRCAAPLRSAKTSFGHGDINMWNVLVDERRAVLIDWDDPRVGDPAMEVALLDKHAHLFNGSGLPASFFAGYGPSAEPNMTVHRLVQTIHWAGSSDWDGSELDPQETPDLQARAAGWLESVLHYLRVLPKHLDRLDTIINAGGCGADRAAPAVD